MSSINLFQRRASLEEVVRFQQRMSLNGHPWRMIVTLDTHSLRSLNDVRAFLDGNAAASSSPPAKGDRYRRLDKTLRQLHYTTLKRADEGVLQVF